MSNAAKTHEKKVRECIARRTAQGWTAEQIAKRVWLCFGYLTSNTDSSITVRMHAGTVTFQVAA